MLPQLDVPVFLYFPFPCFLKSGWLARGGGDRRMSKRRGRRGKYGWHVKQIKNFKLKRKGSSVIYILVSLYLPQLFSLKY